MTTDSQPPEGRRYMYPPLPPGQLGIINLNITVPAPAPPHEIRFIALDVGEAMFSIPEYTRDEAILSLYELLGYDGADTYTGTIVIIEAVGPRAALLALDDINFGAAYLRLDHYKPDQRARRRDDTAADVDESERLH